MQSEKYSFDLKEDSLDFTYCYLKVFLANPGKLS